MRVEYFHSGEEEDPFIQEELERLNDPRLKEIVKRQPTVDILKFIERWKGLPEEEKQMIYANVKRGGMENRPL